MKSFKSISTFIILIICSLFSGLFIYAATSKILDFENFEVQLGQSPLISAYSEFISWTVIMVEILLALLLMVSRLRTLGLVLSLGLMTMFSVYIYLILNFSSFIPCSCGGILEKMSWNSHLIFNIFFIALACLGVFVNEKLNSTHFGRGKIVRVILVESGVMVLSILFVWVLFLSSEQIMHKNNPFLRRYPQHPVEFVNSTDLKHSSYYLAGTSKDRIYIGSYEYPTYMLSVDKKLSSRKLEKLHFDIDKFSFKMISISVQDSYFYLSDGVVPIILRGSVKNWTVTKELSGVPYFTRAVAIDSTRSVFRSNNSKNLANVLGIFNSDSMPKIIYKRELLPAGEDGIFSTDGMLLYSQEAQKIIYLYYYRNEFLVADKNGNLIRRSHTIDTISNVKFKVSKLNRGRQFAVSSPSLVVNANATVYKNLLFVHSLIKGKFENENLWKKSFIIDVYDLNTNTYRFSFPLYHTLSNELSYFSVDDANLYAIIGTELAVYKLNAILKKEFK